MKITNTTLLTVALTSVATFAFARGIGDRSSGSSPGFRAGSSGSSAAGAQDAPRASRTSGQDMSASRSSAGLSRNNAAPVNAAPAPSFTPRAAPSPGTARTAAPSPERRSASVFSGVDSARPAPAPQTRTYTAPRAVVDNSGAPAQVRAVNAPRTTVVREAPTRSITDNVTAREPRASGFPGAASNRENTPRTTVQTTTPRVASDDNARNSGTARGTFPSRQESVVPVTPTENRRTAAEIQRTPVERRQPGVTERTQTTPPGSIGASQPRSANTAITTVPPVNPDRSVSRNTGNPTGLSRATTPGSTPTSSVRQQARDVSVATRGQTTHSGFQRITAPDTRLASPATGRGTSASSMRFGSANDNLRPRAASLSPDGLSTRSARRGADDVRGGSRTAVAGQIPSHITGGRDVSTSDRRPPSSGRYGDGRSSVYNAPDRNTYMNRQAYSRPQPQHHNTSHGGNNHHDHNRHNPYPYHYSHHAFSPVWCGPVVYPASSYFGFSWSNGSFGLSFASCSPAYAYSTRYYDSWSCGGWGYSGVYYGGWHDNWYGGFSYVYNPWPVYRTCYLYEPSTVVVYEPAPVVTRTETVYITEPATTTYVVQSAGATPALQQPATSVVETQQTFWETAPAVERAETVATSCFCPCHCNGQRPCTCDYPCGAEYTVSADQFDLSFGYSSYAETLNPETIWTSYAGLDRWDAYTEPQPYSTTASTDTVRR